MTDTIKVEFIPATHWWNLSKWKLLEDYISANGDITVPAGFISDGASIPWFARRLFSPVGQYFGAAIVHDYLLETENDWDKANDQFWAELNALGIDSWRKRAIIISVKLYGRSTSWSHLQIGLSIASALASIVGGAQYFGLIDILGFIGNFI